MKMENFLKKNLNVDIVYKCTFCTTFKSLRQFQWVLSRVFWTKASESSLEDDA